MNEKFPTKTAKVGENKDSEKIKNENINRMREAAAKFEITRDFYRKAAFDSAEKILEEWLKLKEIKKFQKVYPQF